MTKQFLNPSSSTYIILFLFLFINEDTPKVALLTNSFLFQEFIYHHRCFVPPIAFSAPTAQTPVSLILNTSCIEYKACPSAKDLQANNSSEVSHFKTSLQLISLPVTLSLWIDFEVLKVLCFSNVGNLHNCCTSNFYNIFISTLLLIHNNLHIQFIIAWLSILCDFCRFLKGACYFKWTLV